MTVTLSAAWGGVSVGAPVADALALCQAIAARRGAEGADLADLAAALVGGATDPDDPMVRTLAVLEVDRAGLASQLSGAAWPASSGVPSAPGPEVRDFVSGLCDIGSADHAVTLRLLGELATASAPRLRPLREAGISPDRLRCAAARCGISYAPPRPDTVEPLRPPATPALEDLLQRTPRRRSAVMRSVMGQLMPDKSTTGSPYGIVRARRWALANIAYIVLRPLTMLAIVFYGHHWWSYVIWILVGLTPEALPLAVALVGSITLAVVLGVFYPWPLLALALVTDAAGSISFWYQWWMKRIDIGDPTMPLNAVRRGASQQLDHIAASWRLERSRGR